jgi:hypothetical protein
VTWISSGPRARTRSWESEVVGRGPVVDGAAGARPDAAGFASSVVRVIPRVSCTCFSRPPGDVRRLGAQRAGQLGVSFGQGDGGAAAQRDREAPAGLQLPVKRQCFVESGPRCGQVALEHELHPQARERLGERDGVSYLTGDRLRGRELVPGGGVISLEPGELGGPHQDTGSQGVRRGREREGLPHPAAPFAQVAPHPPELPQCRAEAEGEPGVRLDETPREGGAEVVVLELDRREGLQLARPVEPCAGLLGQYGVEESVPALDLVGVLERSGIRSVLPPQPVAGELPNGLEQAVSGLAIALLHDNEGAVDETGEQVEHVPRAQRPAPADVLGRGERKAARENRKPLQEELLRLREEPVAPVDGCVQRPVPGQGGAGRADQETEGVVQPLRDLLRSQDPHPCGGQFDSQWKPV